MNLDRARIIVTGADGFIGSHLVEALVRDGCDVRAFVFYNSFDSWGWLDSVDPAVAGKFEVVADDIRDPHGVRDAGQPPIGGPVEMLVQVRPWG